MNGLRYGVVLLMLLTLAGGIWTRYHSTKADRPVATRPSFENSELHLTGTFSQPVKDLTGFEVSFPNCSLPLGILPIPASSLQITPAEYRYRPGKYSAERKSLESVA